MTIMNYGVDFKGNRVRFVCQSHCSFCRVSWYIFILLSILGMCGCFFMLQVIDEIHGFSSLNICYTEWVSFWILVTPPLLPLQVEGSQSSITRNVFCTFFLLCFFFYFIILSHFGTGSEQFPFLVRKTS